MTALPKKKYTLEEYLELDRNSEERYEYFDGEACSSLKIAHTLYNMSSNRKGDGYESK